VVGVATKELKPEGKKIKVKNQIKEVFDKFKKDGFIEFIDFGLIEPEESPVLKFKKSTTIAPANKKQHSIHDDDFW